jgi:hypothetical protein
MLLELPSDLVRGILSQWLTLRAVAKLDSSFCCRNIDSDRIQFLSLAYGPTVAYYDDWDVGVDEPNWHATGRHSTAVFEWSTLRGVQLTRVVASTWGNSGQQQNWHELSSNFAVALVFIGDGDLLLCSLLQHFCGIVELTVMGSSADWNVTNDATIACAIQKCPLLKKVYIGGTHFAGATNSIAKSLANYCPELEALEMPLANVDDEGVEALAQKCKKLRVLDIDDCELVTLHGYEALASACPALQELYFTSNSTHQAEQIQELFRHRAVALDDGFVEAGDYNGYTYDNPYGIDDGRDYYSDPYSSEFEPHTVA